MSLEYEYGCLFCRTGKEHDVADNMEHAFPGLKAIVPHKLRYRRSHDTATEEAVILFPGYVFFRCDRNTDICDVLRFSDVFRILTDGEGNWALHGSDRVIADMLMEVEGRIGFSKAHYDGDRLRISEGFLKQYEGSIIRVNHRAKTAQIRMELDGKVFLLWAGFEIMIPEKE